MSREVTGGARPLRMVAVGTGWGVVALALLATALLTLPRLGDPTSRILVQLVAITPLGLGAAVLLFAAALVMAAVSAGRQRILAGAAALLALVAAAAHLTWLAPFYLGSTPVSMPGTPLVVLTQNLEYGDAGALAAEVSRRQVDVLVVCDLLPDQAAALEASAIPRDLPHRADIGSGSTVVFSRHPMSDPARIAPGSRSVEVTTPQLGPVSFVALHPTPPYRAAEWARDYDDIVDHLRGGEVGQLPTIIAGDLNATLDHAPVREIVSFGYTDAMVATRAGYRPTWPAAGSVRRFGVTVPPLVQIDHVLVSDRLVVSQAATVTIPGADHLGVVASVRPAAERPETSG